MFGNITLYIYIYIYGSSHSNHA